MQNDFNKQLRRAEKHLGKSCERMGAWIKAHGKCTLEPYWNREPMESLVRAVAHQQLHGKAAESILRRLTERFPGREFPDAGQLKRLRVATYRTCGFSEAKAEAIRGIAGAMLEGKLPTRVAASSMSDDDLIDLLVELRGIGRWTVEMMLIFTLGRLDVMPVDDFGVKSGLMQMYSLPSMPKKAEFAQWTDAWRPYRSIGAWYLWRFADSQKQKSRVSYSEPKRGQVSCP